MSEPTQEKPSTTPEVFPTFPNTVTTTTPVGETPLELTRIIQVMYHDVEMQINRADLKAQIALSTSAILGALVANLGIGIVTRKPVLWTGMEWAVFIVYVGFLASACATVFHALLAAYPRAIGRRIEEPGLYFGGHLVQMEPGTYVKRFLDQTNRDVLERMLVQVHSKSRVLEAKLAHIRRALRLLGFALLLWAVTRVLLLMAYGSLP